MQFKWDDYKAVANLRNMECPLRGSYRLRGSFLGYYADPDHWEDEDRYRAARETYQGRVVVGVHADRDDDCAHC